MALRFKNVGFGLRAQHLPIKGLFPGSDTLKNNGACPFGSEYVFCPFNGNFQSVNYHIRNPIRLI